MGHGHVIPNSDGSVARCGGPALCSVCALEQASISRPASGGSVDSKSVEPGSTPGDRAKTGTNNWTSRKCIVPGALPYIVERYPEGHCDACRTHYAVVHERDELRANLTLAHESNHTAAFYREHRRAELVTRELGELQKEVERLRADNKRLGQEVEEMMKVDYWQDRYNIEKARADELQAWKDDHVSQAEGRRFS